MRRITAIPAKKIAFKNVPVSGLFFLKRTLFKKISVREACHYNSQKQIYFEPNEIVRFIAKQHENIAIELFEEKVTAEQTYEFNINDSVEIISRSICGKVVSVNRNNCLIQYKEGGSVSFHEFPNKDIRKMVQ